MISTQKLSLSFGGAPLFEDVNIKFLQGNCYGLIGANGAGKSTFLKILSGDIDPTSGILDIEDGKRIAVLKQDQFAYDEVGVLETVLMGHKSLYKVYAERKELYEKSEMTDAEGLRVADLEGEFAEMDGYVAESDAATMLSELGIMEDLQDKQMGDLEAGQKIRVLLAQALFGDPDILLLDEPTNQLDYLTVMWLEKFLMDFKNLVIVVSHDRHFLNKVCTHIADVDYKKILVSVGNYDFWQKVTEMSRQQKQDQNKKKEDKIKDLEEFVRRFSANASKAKQATSRKKLIEKLRPEDLPESSRRNPYIGFKAQRPCGNSILEVENLSYTANGEPILKDVNFVVEKGNKIAFVGRNTLSRTTLLQILAGEVEPDSGVINWGESISSSYFPKDNSEYFETKLNLIEWLSQYTQSDDEQFIRGFLGRMLFSGDDAKKNVQVLSGGKKARAMFSKMMLSESNVNMLDEPTDHLDLESITALNDGLEKFSECLLFTSHDFQLLNTVANRVIEVSPLGTLDQKTDFNDFMTSESIRDMRQRLYAEPISALVK
ncbi:MAG: ATPase subunit of ABC transporter with duplicated ATPase domains [Candidatus Marinamargulisbacteria bacterium]|jgi:ATPase subunit of ABC transporter with duplicated ATPase domains